MQEQALLMDFPNTDSPSCFRNQKPYGNKLDLIQTNTNSQPNTIILQLSQARSCIITTLFVIPCFLQP